MTEAAKKTGLAKINEAADFLSVSRKTVYEMIKDGELKSVPVRGRKRVRWSQLYKIENGLSKRPRRKK